MKSLTKTKAIMEKAVEDVLKRHNRTFIKLRISELEDKIAECNYKMGGYFAHPHWGEELKKYETQLKYWKKRYGKS